MPRGAVKFLTCDVLIDLGRAFAVRAVGAADVLGVGNPGRTLFPGACSIATVATEGTTLAAALRTVTKGLTLTTVTAVRTTFFAITTRTIKVPRTALRTATKGLTLATVTVERATLAITGRTITERLTLATVAVERATLFAVTARTIEVPRAALRTVTERLTLATVTVERATLAITGRTITTVTEGLAITIATE
jgi:hypothetical protein